MLTPYLPYPPASGGQIRTLNLLKYLSLKNDITLVSLYKNDEEKKYLPHLKPYCKSVYLCKRAEKPWQLEIILKSIFSFRPFLVVRNFSPQAEEILERLVKEKDFDVIHAETFYIMPHIPNTNIPIFLVEQTIEYKVYQHFINSLNPLIKPVFYLDILKLKYWERHYWRKAALVGAVSESDRKSIEELEPGINPVVIPNGAGEEMVVNKIRGKNIRQPLILFQGNFSWLQNTEAANFLIKKIYPKLIKTMPNIKIIIAGQNAKNKILVDQFLATTNNIDIIDIEPDNVKLVKKMYEQSTLFVAPIFGPGGTRLKILAAMATGLPVISTKTGVEGLDVVDNHHVLIASSSHDFVKKIEKILSNKSLYEKIRNNAYLLVKEKYNWEKITQELEIVYEKIKGVSLRKT